MKKKANCLWCLKEFNARAWNPSIFCSQVCYKAAGGKNYKRDMELRRAGKPNKTKAEINRDYYYKNLDKIRRSGREYYRKNAKKQRNNTLKRRYGIDLQLYEKLIRIQDNKCAICKEPERAVQYTSGKIKPLSVDHNHSTGKVRELLCYRCNSILGFIENFPEIHAAILQYLERHNTSSE